jgi:2-methylcitrate dehydratase PrpD
VPQEVRRSAARHLLDGVGCAIGGVTEPAARAALHVAAQQTAPAESTVLGDGRRLPAPAAALANGALMHALDFDDTHADALVHATAAVLPAAFAVGEEFGRSGRDVLTAAVAGYEVVTRLGAVVPHGFHARGFHATSVCGVFAAALVAARLADLDENAAVAALGIAGSAAAGSLEFLNTGASTKQLHPGLAAQAGITAARLAAAGATGPTSILEGSYGLYRSYLGQDVDPDALTHGLGAVWETTRITIKPYPACQLSHPSLDAVRALRVQVPDVRRIARIDIAVPADAVDIVCEPRAAKVTPRSAYEAKFSLPWCAAALLLDGDLTSSSFARVDRDEVVALADRVTCTSVPAGRPPAAVDGHVIATLQDGSTVEATAPAGRALSDDELVTKFVGNAGGHRDAAGLARDLLHLDRCVDLPALFARTAPLGARQEVA